MTELVFGYGSLVAEHGARPAVLEGWRRTWGVAMDNTIDIPGYKLYRAPDGTRPDVCVAFLDIEPAPGESVAGVLFAGDIELLDRREVSYERTAVEIEGEHVWTYTGTPERRARLQAARAAGRAVIAAAYARSVAALIAPDLPVMELERVPIPTEDGYLIVDGHRTRAFGR